MPDSNGQVGALPAAAHAPPHVLKTAFPLGVAVNSTLVPAAYDSVQSAPQFMPGPVTVPGPVFETVRVNPDALIVKLTAFDMLPSGSATLTCAVPDDAMSAESTRPQGLNILFVEDHDDTAVVVSKLLRFITRITRAREDSTASAMPRTRRTGSRLV